MSNGFESLWETVKSWANNNAKHYICATIPQNHTDLSGSDAPLIPQRDYLRLWLVDMFLAQDRNWFVDVYPAVHTSVELNFGRGAVKISHVTDGSGQLGRGVFNDYALTDLLPFNGGTVKIQSGLIALKGTNYLAQTIGILKDFSGLVAAPLNQTLAIADKVTSGVQSLFTGGAGEVALGFHRQYASGGGGGGSVLAPGYTALILATADQINKDRLSVKESQLLYAERDGKEPKPLEGYNYLLFRIEGRSERDNWRMPNIEEPLNQAIQATIKKGPGDADAEGYKKAALLVIWQSPDLAVQDRRRVADAIEAELADVAGQAHGAEPAAVRSLEDIMKARAMPASGALYSDGPELTLDEILGR
jgi:hypothetical protein